MGRRHFCNFLCKTKRWRQTSCETLHFSYGICISTWQFWSQIRTYLGFWLRLVKKRVLVVQLNFGLFVWHSFGTFLLALSISWSLIEDWRPWRSWKRRKGVQRFWWKRKPEVLLEPLLQQQKPPSYHLQPLPELQRNNFIPFFKLCLRWGRKCFTFQTLLHFGEKCSPATAFAASNTALVAVSPFTLPFIIPVNNYMQKF